MNRDRMPKPVRLASAADWKHVSTWLEGAGLSSANDSFLGNVVHLQMGVGYRVAPDHDVFFSAGSGFHVGFTFR